MLEWSLVLVVLVELSMMYLAQIIHVGINGKIQHLIDSLEVYSSNSIETNNKRFCGSLIKRREKSKHYKRR